MATDAREEEGALDLGVKLMSKFARSSRGHRRTTRQVFAVWKRYHETIKKNTMYAMNIANLMAARVAAPQLFQVARATPESARGEPQGAEGEEDHGEEQARSRVREVARRAQGGPGRPRESPGRGLQRIARRVLAGAFYDWAELLEDRRRRVDEAAEKVRQDEARAERAERLARSYDNKLRRLDRVKGERLARLALARWRRRASEAGRRGGSWRAPSRGSPDATWRERTPRRARAAEDRRKRVAVRRAVNRMTRRALAGAFDAWRVVPRDARRRDVRAATARSHPRRGVESARVPRVLAVARPRGGDPRGGGQAGARRSGCSGGTSRARSTSGRTPRRCWGGRGRSGERRSWGERRARETVREVFLAARQGAERRVRGVQGHRATPGSDEARRGEKSASVAGEDAREGVRRVGG